MKRKGSLYVLGFSLFLFLTTALQAQISAPGSSGSGKTSYPVFQATDSIFVFCAANEMGLNGVLRVQTQLQGSKTFLWEKYNPSSDVFEFYFSENSANQQSAINGLADGCYRATVTLGGTTEVHRAWVFNNWITGSGSSTDSNCQSFKLIGTFLSGSMIYYDLANHTEQEVFKDMKVQWKLGQEVIASVLNPQIFNPPSKDTKYTFRVYDRFGCDFSTEVNYSSIVTDAKFSVDPKEGEAPLTVNFVNQSENGDPNLYEWFFYRNLDEIKRESQNTQGPIDSIMIVAYDQNPVYTYEFTGLYKVKLISKKVSQFHTCVDTFYMDDYIVVDSSFVAVPNVFTPNGDGVNDAFVVKFWSMKELKITLFNRWGKKIHFWESGDVRGFEGTWDKTVWDGKIGGRYASPGVYYYMVEGLGRDDKKRRAHGFVHLFRDND